jgi:uncharacterized damage-inducible protein DinB
MSIGSMTGHAEIGRVDPVRRGGELELLGQYLDYHRATLQMKCAGLDEEQLKRRSLPTTGLTLLGLVRHLTEVERGWFVRTLAGQPAPPRYYGPDNPDGDFDSLDSHPVEEVWRRYHAAVAEARAVLGSFTTADDVARRDAPDQPNVRWVLLHLLEEYARHNGHADLLRQAVDGEVGE